MTNILPIGFSIKNGVFDCAYDHIPKQLLNDKLYINNVFSNNIISTDIYPVIYSQVNTSDTNYYRSVDLYDKIKNSNILIIPKEYKTIYLVGLRDLVFATNNHLISDYCIDKLLVADVLDEYTHIINNLRIQPFPSKYYCIIKWIEYETTLPNFIDNNGKKLCFVNIYDISYNNIENIISIETHISSLRLSYDKNIIVNKLRTGIYTFKLDESFNALLSISDLGLMTEPLNNQSRGGKRLIFKSDILRRILTNTIESAFANIRPIIKNFRYVNEVFRYNIFNPGDKKFTSHYDTPFVSKAYNLASKYTMIIYLTSDNQSESLTIDSVSYPIDSLQVYIFDHAYLHEGNSFKNNKKVFIRTELVYYCDFLSDPNKFDLAISEQFNRSCYMTKQSVLDCTIKENLNEMFNLTNAARYKLADITESPIVYLLKEYNGYAYVTDGNKYWVKIGENQIKDFVVTMLVDYFGAVPSQRSFGGDKTKTKNIHGFPVNIDKNDPDSAIYKLLLYHTNTYENTRGFHHIKLYSERNTYVCPPVKICHDCEINLDNIDITHIVKYHNPLILECNSTIESYSCTIMGEKIKINTDDIVISDNFIEFKNTGLRSAVIFASCSCEWRGLDVDYCSCSGWRKCNCYQCNLNVSYCEADCYSLPDIYYKKISVNYYCFTINIFNNGYIHDSVILTKPRVDMYHAKKPPYDCEKGTENRIDYGELEFNALVFCDDNKVLNVPQTNNVVLDDYLGKISASSHLLLVSCIRINNIEHEECHLCPSKFVGEFINNIFYYFCSIDYEIEKNKQILQKCVDTNDSQYIFSCWEVIEDIDWEPNLLCGDNGSYIFYSNNILEYIKDKSVADIDNYVNKKYEKYSKYDCTITKHNWWFYVAVTIELVKIKYIASSPPNMSDYTDLEIVMLCYASLKLLDKLSKYAYNIKH
jgi:hypothetical protein